MIPSWLDFLFASNLMSTLVAISLVGLWMLSRRSLWGFAAVGLHFGVTYWLLLNVHELHPERLPLTQAAGLWGLIMSLGWASFVAHVTPPSIRLLRSLFRAVYWKARWYLDRRERAAALLEAADKLGAPRNPHKLVWEPHSGCSLEAWHGGAQGTGKTTWAYHSYGRIPLSLRLEASPQGEEKTASPAPDWLSAFAIEDHWRPFTAVHANHTRPFGALEGGALLAGVELEVLTHLSPAFRMQLDDLASPLHFDLHEGVLTMSHPGFVYEELATLARQLQTLGDTLAQSDDVPARLFANLQAETEPLLQIRLLEFLLGHFPDTTAAEHASAWAAKHEDPYFALLCGIAAGAEGCAALQTLVQDSSHPHKLRRGAWVHIWQHAPEDEATALMQALLEEPEEPFCPEVVRAAAQRPTARAAALTCQWFQALETPRTQAAEEALLDWYRAHPTATLERCAFALLYPKSDTAAAVLRVAEQKGDSHTLKSLHIKAREFKKAPPAQYDAAQLCKAIEQSIEFLRMTLEAQNHGQLSLAPLEENEGNLSLTPEEEAAGQLSVTPEEGQVSLVEEPS